MAKFIKRVAGSNDEVVLYSYWLDHWATAASIYKKVFNKKCKVVSRVHRYEIDPNTNRWSTFPFLKLQLLQLNAFCFISSNWLRYFATSYPSFRGKYFLNRMGVDLGKSSPVPQSQETIKVVSIFGDIPVKQMELQSAYLVGLDMFIEWHHYGGNIMENRLGKLVENSKVEYLNHGFLKTKNLLRELDTQPFHFLLNTSKVEGVPVSMMECIGRGIPIVAFDIGGVSEIVNNKNGLLLSFNQSIDKNIQELKHFIFQYRFTMNERTNIQAFFKENYLAAKNYTDFCK